MCNSLVMLKYLNIFAALLDLIKCCPINGLITET